MSAINCSEALVPASSKTSIPEQPYLINEGKYRGHYLESLIFENPVAFFEVEKNGAICKNGLHKQTKFIMSVKLRTKMTCQMCGQGKVEFFVPSSRLFLYRNTACSHCVSDLTAAALDNPVYRIEINSLRYFAAERQKDAARFFAVLYGLIRKDHNGIFEFFRDSYFDNL